MLARLRAALPLAGMLALAAALRFTALDFGLPYPHARPDEGTAVGHAVAILSGDPNPHFFHWPSLALYVFAAVLAIAHTFGAALTAPQQVVLVRAVVAAAGTLTVVPAARITASLAGRDTPVAGRDAALTAALFLAVAPLHVRESHFAMTDVLMTLFVTIALALAVRARETGRARTFSAAGAAAGIAASTKYNAAALLAVVLAAPTVLAAFAFLASFTAAF